MNTIMVFFSEIKALFFDFQKKAGEVYLLPLSCAHMSVAGYASISLNITK